MTESKIKDLITYWEQGSLEDLSSAEDIILKAKRYQQGLFFVHLSIEKILKAAVVKETNTHAPMTHNLLFLAQKAKLTLSTEQLEILSEINSFNMSMRYPDEIEKIKKKSTQEMALKILDQAKALHLWILQNFKN